MPRLSVEARAAAAARSGGHHPPPKHLCPAAKAMWRAIVTERPADWFDAGSAPLLGIYCTLSVLAERLEPAVAEGDIKAARRLREISGTLTTLATKLRLSVQSTVRRGSGKLSERGPALSPLLGGSPALRLIGGKARSDAL